MLHELSSPCIADLVLVHGHDQGAKMIRIGQHLWWLRRNRKKYPANISTLINAPYTKPWQWNHIAFVSQVEPDAAPWIIEAKPGGSRELPFHYAEGQYLIVHVDLTLEQRQAALAKARQLVGTPYNWNNIISLALWIVGIRPGWVEGICKRENGEVCSQLYALSLQAASLEPWGDPYLVFPALIAAHPQIGG